jgi:hypothetical protein
MRVSPGLSASSGGVAGALTLGVAVVVGPAGVGGCPLPGVLAQPASSAVATTATDTPVRPLERRPDPALTQPG